MSRIINHRRTGLLMAAYAFLLVLGAALPLAASYGEGATRQVSEGEIEIGGYHRRADDVLEASDATVIKVRPPQRFELASAEADAEPVCSLERAPLSKDLNHHRFRGS